MTTPNSHPPRVAEPPEWFRHLPFAPWGWRELNLYGWPLLAATVGLALLQRPWCWFAILPAIRKGRDVVFTE